MLTRLDKNLDIFGPLQQAERCLELWLKEEGRDLPARHKARAAALIARYFENEDDANDALILSFLRHYSGMQAIDMEDPTSVRMEIKAVMDRAAPAALAAAAPSARRVIFAFAIGLALAVLGLGGWHVTHKTITEEQQETLRALVRDIAATDTTRAPAAIWNEVKKPLNVKSYQDIRWLDYARARTQLQQRLKQAREAVASPVAPGAGM